MRQLSLSGCAAARCNYQAQQGASFHFETHFLHSSKMEIPQVFEEIVIKCASKEIQEFQHVPVRQLWLRSSC